MFRGLKKIVDSLHKNVKILTWMVFGRNCTKETYFMKCFSKKESIT